MKDASNAAPVRECGRTRKSLISWISLDEFCRSQLYSNRDFRLGLQLNEEVWVFRRPQALDIQTTAMEKSTGPNRMGFSPRKFLIPGTYDKSTGLIFIGISYH